MKDTRRHVVVAVLVSEERQGWVNPHLSAALVALAFDPRFRMTYLPINSLYPVSAARNHAVNETIAHDGDWLLMIDNDIKPPFELCNVIARADFIGDIIALPYMVMLRDGLMLCVGKLENGVMMPYVPGEMPSGWNRIETAGTGCMLINRAVLSSPKLKHPLFEIVTDALVGQKMSEDIWFTKRITEETGYTIWTNPDLMCGHYRTTDLALLVAPLMVEKRPE